MFSAFLPAVSRDALQEDERGSPRPWRIHLRTATELDELAAWINPVVRGWMTYYGRFLPGPRLGRPGLKRINTYLVRWAPMEVTSGSGPYKKAPEVGGTG